MHFVWSYACINASPSFHSFSLCSPVDLAPVPVPVQFKQSMFAAAQTTDLRQFFHSFDLNGDGKLQVHPSSHQALSTSSVRLVCAHQSRRVSLARSCGFRFSRADPQPTNLIHSPRPYPTIRSPHHSPPSTPSPP